jgi:hypothetical protein
MASILGGPLGEEKNLQPEDLLVTRLMFGEGCNDKADCSIGPDTKMIKKNSTAKNLACR